MRTKRNCVSCSQYQSEDRAVRLRKRLSLSCSLLTVSFCAVMSTTEPHHSTEPSAWRCGVPLPSNQRTPPSLRRVRNSHFHSVSWRTDSTVMRHMYFRSGAKTRLKNALASARTWASVTSRSSATPALTKGKLRRPSGQS